MSVVAVKICKDGISMAADSIAVCGWNRKDHEHFKMAKMVKVNNMLVGSCGYMQEGSMFQVFAVNHRPEGTKIKDVVAFMIEFQVWLKELSINLDEKESGDNKKKINNQYLIAYDGHAFSVDGWDVVEIKDFYAIGAGEDFALAALHLGYTPSEAVKVACDMSCYVAEPIIEEWLPI